VLSNRQPRYAADDGAPDRDVAATLSAYAAGRATEQAALIALSRSRLLMPLLEREMSGDDGGACDHSHDGTDEACGHSGATGHAAEIPAGHANERRGHQAGQHGGQQPGHRGAGRVNQQRGQQGGSRHGNERGTARGAREMAMPRLIGADGRPAILAFTSLDALLGWRPDARPVPAEAGQVWSTAVEDSCAVVIDVAGPVPLAVEGARLAALAAGQPPPAPYADPDVRAQVAGAIADAPGIAGAELAEGPPGTDLAVRLLVAAPTANPTANPTAKDHGAGAGAAGNAAASADIRGAAEAIVAGLASRLRRGIEVSAAPAPAVAAAPGSGAPPEPGPGAPPEPGPASRKK
jgi:hypothetical protein